MNKREWLLNYRLKKGYTQYDVAKQTGISRTTYAMIETGKRNPSVKVAKRIASVLDFDWTIFFEIEIHESCRNVETA